MVRSDVSIRIPSETASEGAAIAFGRFTAAGATGSGDGGPRNVSSKPMVTFFFPPERADDAVVLAETSFRALPLVSAGVVVEREFPLDEAGRFADATTAFDAGFALLFKAVWHSH